MPTERLSMRHIREVLRLHHSVGMSQRSVARSLGLAQGTVSKYLNRTRRAGLTWPLPLELDDDVSIDLSFRHSRPANGYVTATTWPSSAQPEQGSPGWLAPSATKPAATVSPSSINERRASLPTSPRRAAKVVFLA